jgi:hypothetical protein
VVGCFPAGVLEGLEMARCGDEERKEGWLGREVTRVGGWMASSGGKGEGGRGVISMS